MQTFRTVKEIADLIRPNWVEKVEKQNKYVVITTATNSLSTRPCDNCKSGAHKSPVSAPRIKIKQF